MENNEYKMSLWEDFLEEDTELKDAEKRILVEIAVCYKDDISFLMKVYEAFIENDRFIQDEGNDVRYEREKDLYIFSMEGREVCLGKERFKRILISMLDILEETLPLGTVVDLRKDIYKGVPGMEEVEYIRMVITHRFLKRAGSTYYYPYAGVVYPTGMLGKAEVFNFTRPAVEKVIQQGYSDEQEEVFSYLMKKSLIVDAGGNSIGFATKEEAEELNQAFKEGETDE